MAKRWQTFLRKFDDIKEGELKLFIKDLTPGPRKYDTKFVRVFITKSKEKLLDSDDILIIRSESGLESPDFWFMKILEELPPWVTGKPWEDLLEVINKTEDGSL